MKILKYTTESTSSKLGKRMSAPQKASVFLLICLALLPHTFFLQPLMMLLLLLLSRFSRVQLGATPQTAAHHALPSLGSSRQEHWSGLPFPSPRQESESEFAQSCPTLHDPMDCSLPGSSAHGIFQARDHAFLHQQVHGRLPEAELHFSLTCNKGLQQRLPLSCFTLRPL